MDVDISVEDTTVDSGQLIDSSTDFEQNQNDDDESSSPTLPPSSNNKRQRRRRIVIEDFTKFSNSKLWDLMMRFYDQNGVSSWADGIVPHFISSNAFIGRTYAKLIRGFFQDLKRQREQNRCNCNSGKSTSSKDRFYIVEIGGGTGKLAFYILRALEEMKDVIGFPLEQIVYVLTDFTESNITFWKQQENLKPYVDSGRLEFAKFEAVNDIELHLMCSGTILKKGHVLNPICIVANYLIDTLCNDVFQVHDGQLKEGLVSVGVDEKYKMKYDVDGNIDCNDPEIINNLQNEYQYNTVDCNYYADSVAKDDIIHYSEMMSWYHQNCNDKHGASFLIPVGFLKAIRNLSDLSSGKALIISGDKGNSNPDYFRGICDPHIALHGSFSIMVNFHAIGLYIKSRRGLTWYGDQEESSLQVNCFFLDNQDGGSLSYDTAKMESIKKKKFIFLSSAFQDTINGCNPNDFFVLQRSLKEEANPTLLPILSILKLSNWDPEIFYKFRDVILPSLQSCSSSIHKDLEKGISKLWDNYYHLGDCEHGKDIAFELGRVCYGLTLFERALEFYQISVKLYGEHHITSHNTGLCQFALLKYKEAKVFFQQAIHLNPQYDKSKTWLEKIEKMNC